VRLAKKYPEYIFSQSSAAMYRDVMERDPVVFQGNTLLVKEGRWELLGGMWVESDTNLLNGESLVRQFLYGQRFFMEHFGRKCSTVWLPDVFGFSWILPQIIRKAGMDSFFTTKMTWNEKNSLPHDLFVWRGIDGSEVIYHSFKNPSNGYNGLLEPKDILTTAKNFKDQDLFPETVFSFGYGDGGGGPTDEIDRKLQVLKDLPGIPELVMRSLRVTLSGQKRSLARFTYMTANCILSFTVATYTSQGRIKMAHKDVVKIC
jgi:alpha-mannosidase